MSSTAAATTTEHPESHRVRQVVIGLGFAAALGGLGYVAITKLKEGDDDDTGPDSTEEDKETDPKAGEEGEGDNAADEVGSDGDGGEGDGDGEAGETGEETGEEKDAEEGGTSSGSRISKGSFTDVSAFFIYICLLCMVFSSFVLNFFSKGHKWVGLPVAGVVVSMALSVIAIPSFGYANSPGMWSVFGIALAATFFVTPHVFTRIFSFLGAFGGKMGESPGMLQSVANAAGEWSKNFGDAAVREKGFAQQMFNAGGSDYMDPSDADGVEGKL